MSEDEAIQMLIKNVENKLEREVNVFLRPFYIPPDSDTFDKESFQQGVLQGLDRAIEFAEDGNLDYLKEIKEQISKKLDLEVDKR